MSPNENDNKLRNFCLLLKRQEIHKCQRSKTLVSRQNTRKEIKSVKHKVETNNILEEKYGKHSSTTCYTTIQQTI